MELLSICMQRSLSVALFFCICSYNNPLWRLFLPFLLHVFSVGGKKKPHQQQNEPFQQPTDRPTGSVYDLRVSVVTLQVGEDVVGVPAAEVAEAGLDPQHLPAEGGAVGAAELHLHRLGLVGDAAALVRAHATVLGPVGPGAGAA